MHDTPYVNGKAANFGLAETLANVVKNITGEPRAVKALCWQLGREGDGHVNVGAGTTLFWLCTDICYGVCHVRWEQAPRLKLDEGLSYRHEAKRSQLSHTKDMNINRVIFGRDNL